MNVLFTDNGWADYLFWEGNDKRVRNRINQLLKDIARNGPLSGLGKPEPLAGNLKGCCSRRIDEANRLVYKVSGDGIIVVLSCRYHYSDY